MLFGIDVGDVIVSALVLSGTYTLLGLSWVIIFRATRVLNLAVGQFMALGAYLAFPFMVTFHLPFIFPIALALLSMMLFPGITLHLFAPPLPAHPPFSPLPPPP